MMAFLTATACLAIAVLSMYGYQAADHEVTKMLTAGMAIVFMIWGLASAHWGLNLLCLFLLMHYKFPFMWKPVAIEK